MEWGYKEWLEIVREIRASLKQVYWPRIPTSSSPRRTVLVVVVADLNAREDDDEFDWNAYPAIEIKLTNEIFIHN